MGWKTAKILISVAAVFEPATWAGDGARDSSSWNWEIRPFLGSRLVDYPNESFDGLLRSGNLHPDYGGSLELESPAGLRVQAALPAFVRRHADRPVLWNPRYPVRLVEHRSFFAGQNDLLAFPREYFYTRRVGEQLETGLNQRTVGAGSARASLGANRLGLLVAGTGEGDGAAPETSRGRAATAPPAVFAAGAWDFLPSGDMELKAVTSHRIQRTGDSLAGARQHTLGGLWRAKLFGGIDLELHGLTTAGEAGEGEAGGIFPRRSREFFSRSLGGVTGRRETRELDMEYRLWSAGPQVRLNAVGYLERADYTTQYGKLWRKRKGRDWLRRWGHGMEVWHAVDSDRRLEELTTRYSLDVETSGYDWMTLSAWQGTRREQNGIRSPRYGVLVHTRTNPERRWTAKLRIEFASIFDNQGYRGGRSGSRTTALRGTVMDQTYGASQVWTGWLATSLEHRDIFERYGGDFFRQTREYLVGMELKPRRDFGLQLQEDLVSVEERDSGIVRQWLRSLVRLRWEIAPRTELSLDLMGEANFIEAVQEDYFEGSVNVRRSFP